METIDILKNLGFSGVESKIYLATLELGTAPASEIAVKADVQRTYVYDLAEKLVEAGLLKQVSRGKKTLFHAADPQILLDKENERLRCIQEGLPGLKALYNTASKKPRIFFYEGMEGLEHINNETLTKGNEIIAFATPLFVSKAQQKLSRQYIKDRKERGTHARIIAEMSSEMLEMQRRDKAELRETRLLPQDAFSSAVEIGMVESKVYMIDYQQDFGFIIEGKEFAHTFKKIFELVWSSHRMIPKEKE